ncbi:MAG: thioredoxin domain-containing protein [Parachlamydiaceae bacterium]|nr:thioredoxin domain-containing protein [Parachlamydiaceae bacterium]
MSDEQLPSTNRLAREKSPYLLQHAHNPVDWYPWGNEAFQAAKELDRPIFLSIGYATCHWCHVMERESFENFEVAKLMNDAFINIKVDREELPEVDSLYMEFAQSMMAGTAGWPLNVILTPDLQPIFAATYLPLRSSHGLMGLIELVVRIQQVWHSPERDRIEEQAEKIVEVFHSNILTQGEDLPEKELIDDSAEMLFKMADSIYGGMKSAPKFPVGYQMNFILRYAATRKDSRALFYVERTLEMMHRGGIYDHLGGGFSRYSVDERWFLPHFEKMLYDNALLAQAYLEAWQATKKMTYRHIAEEVLNYVLREMTHPEGGFYSAEDADSEGHEGYFYTWQLKEVEALLGKKESALFCEYYDITQAGNFEGRNILHTVIPEEEFARKKGVDRNDLESLLSLQRQVLWQARQQRIHPFKDDKILSSWNGLMIYSMALATNGEENQKYLQAAKRSASFLKTHLWHNGLLLRRWRDGEALYEASLEEYAFLCRGLLALFEADAGVEWLEWALQLNEIVQSNFKSEKGAYFQTSGHEENIILRRCQFSDGAEPSGNAIQCENLLKLYQLTGEERFLEDAEEVLKAVEELVDNYPPGYCYHLMNLNRYYDKNAVLIVISLNDKEEYKDELFELLTSNLIAHRSIVWRRNGDNLLQSLLPDVKDKVPINSKTTLYICHQGVCKNPVTLFADMREAILELA